MLLPVSEFAGVPTTHRVTGKTQNNVKLCFVSSVFHYAENISTPCFRGEGRLQHRRVFVLKTYWL